jgi:hypothetical protein
MIQRPSKSLALVMSVLTTLAFFAALALPRVARADDAEQRRVVGVLALPDDPLADRLRAELTSVGYGVIVTGSPDRDASRAAIEVLARRLDAVGLLRVVPPESEVEVWVIDRVASSATRGRATLVEVVRPEVVSTAPPEHATTVIAVRAVEILRASLAEVDAGRIPVEVARPVRPTAAAPRRVDPDPDPFAVRVGPAILGSTASAHRVLSQPLVAALAEVSWVPSRIGVRAFAVAPLTYGTAYGSEGSVRIRPWTLGLAGRLELAAHNAKVQPSLGTGLALEWVRVGAVANAPYRAQSDSAYSLLPFVDARLSMRITPVLTLVSDALLGYAVAEPTVRIAGRTVAGWGRPMVAVVPISVELSFR